MEVTREQVKDFLKSMSLIDAATLVKELESELGVSAAAPIAVAAAGVKALAELPPKEVILAQLLGLIQAPASQLVRTLNEPGARLARLVDALAKRADGGAA